MKRRYLLTHKLWSYYSFVKVIRRVAWNHDVTEWYPGLLFRSGAAWTEFNCELFVLGGVVGNSEISNYGRCPGMQKRTTSGTRVPIRLGRSPRRTRFAQDGNAGGHCRQPKK